MNIREHLDGFWRGRKLSSIRLRVSLSVILMALVAIFMIIHFEMSSLLPTFLNNSTTASVILISALFAVFFHYIFDFIGECLMPKPPGEIPFGFYEETLRVVFMDFGFYRMNTQVIIGPICLDKDKQRMKFTLKSDIIIANSDKGNIDIKYDAGPLAGNVSVLPDEIYYKIGTFGGTRTKKEPDSHIRVKESIRIDRTQTKFAEICVIYYDLGKGEVTCLKDDHTWLSPVSGGLSVHLEFPEYQCSVVTLGEPAPAPFRREHDGRSFSHPEAVFANQGFSWSIEKEVT